MANEQKVTWSISVFKSPPMNNAVTDNIFSQLGNISSGKSVKGSVTASHTADTVVPLNEVAGICGYMSFNNPSGTETVLIKVGSAGATWAELRPGAASGLVPIPADATPYVRATGSLDVDISYTIWAR